MGVYERRSSKDARGLAFIICTVGMIIKVINELFFQQ